MKAKNNVIRLVFTALLAAFACVATLVIHIPSPLGGYINLGDCIVLVSGWLLGPLYGFIAGGLGSAIADLCLGYALYAPATLVIKGLQAVVAYLIFSALHKVRSKPAVYAVSAVTAQLIMVGGYYIFEGFLYGFAEALVNVAPNLIQSVAGIVSGVIIILIIDKTHAADKFGIKKR